MDNSLKGYKDENIITLIGKMEAGEVPYDLNDLKTFMTEATDRKLPQEHIDRLGVLIKNEILKDVVSTSDYRKNAEINYAEQFGDDEPVSAEQEEKTEQPEETPAVAEETKVVPTVDENGIAPWKFLRRLCVPLFLKLWIQITLPKQFPISLMF
jgi:hypothetical protein